MVGFDDPPSLESPQRPRTQPPTKNGLGEDDDSGNGDRSSINMTHRLIIRLLTSVYRAPRSPSHSSRTSHSRPPKVFPPFDPTTTEPTVAVTDTYQSASTQSPLPTHKRRKRVKPVHAPCPPYKAHSQKIIPGPFQAPTRSLDCFDRFATGFVHLLRSIPLLLV